MVTDLGHPAFATYRIEESLEFYSLLGLEEAFRLHHDDGSLMLVYLHVAGDRFIEIFPEGPTPEDNRVQSFMHLCLLVDDLEKVVATLQQEGVSLDADPKTGLDHNLQAWVRDPDGNAIELMQLDERSPQRQTTYGASRG